MAAAPCHQLLGAILMFFLLHPFAAKSRPVKFESFETVQKGDVGHGITQVKQFLRAYGYYPREADPSDDRFDDALESALKAYQEFYSLDVTGKIDPDTIKAMSTPRCGVPDINLEQTSNYFINHGNNKWDKYGLTYNYLSNSSQVPNLAQFKQAIARAFATWRSASKFTFSEVIKGGTADIGIGFYRKDHGDRIPFDGPTPPSGQSVLAHASYPGSLYMFLHFDADENWSVNPTLESQFDVESIALHEIGHNLGLDHSLDPRAVMYATFSGGTETKRTLDKDDIAGITELYK